MQYRKLREILSAYDILDFIVKIISTNHTNIKFSLLTNILFTLQHHFKDQLYIFIDGTVVTKAKSSNIDILSFPLF